MEAVSEHAFASTSVEETRRLGEALGRHLQAGDFVGLDGPLGAGKTELVRGIAAGAGVPPERVTSPTFALVASYAGRIAVHHVDLYRVADEKELYATGFFALAEDDPGALVVEWAGRVPSAAPADRLHVELADGGGTARTIRARTFGPRAAALLEAWRAAV